MSYRIFWIPLTDSAAGEEPRDRLFRDEEEVVLTSGHGRFALESRHRRAAKLLECSSLLEPSSGSLLPLGSRGTNGDLAWGSGGAAGCAAEGSSRLEHSKSFAPRWRGLAPTFQPA